MGADVKHGDSPVDKKGEEPGGRTKNVPKNSS